MKMKKEHYIKLQSGINNLLLNNPDIISDYETGNFPRSEKVKILQIRFIWDLFWKLHDVNFFAYQELSYLNDDHITTALKKACPIIQRKY